MMRHSLSPSHGRKAASLLNGCALALALSVLAKVPQAQGQAFQGTPTVVGGSTQAVVIQEGPADLVLIRNGEVVIDWEPTDTTGPGTIDFLPDTTSALFVNDAQFPAVTDFTVLNRIQPVDASGNPTLRPVAFNGLVQSEINGLRGGSVWFYSPGGVIAGPTAVFDVGSLVLTTNAIDTTGGLFGSSGEIRFAGTPGSTSLVTIHQGAQINALSPGSYVALVAPSVQQFGTVNVNGSVAYVGAEAANIAINGGLFDIIITAGTDDANGVIHTGTTNLTDAGQQRAFIAAVPKNSALTLLLTGDFGYTPAASAATQDSAVILSAGHNISFGNSLGVRNSSTNADATISIGNSSFVSPVNGRATGSITINPTGSGTISFSENAAFKAATSITAGADDGETIDVGTDLSLDAGLGGVGGIASLYAAGSGQVTVGGTLRITTSAVGADNFTPGGTGGSATGGTSEIRTNGGSISAGNIELFSTAAAGLGGLSSGTATGGTARIALTGGSITTSDILMDVSAVQQQFSTSITPLNGGNSTGGNAQIGVNGGTLTAGTMFINAEASGAGADTGGTSGNATGGTANIAISGLGQFALTGCANGTCDISVNARGGEGFVGGRGTGGTITITAQDGIFASDGDMFLSADGFGGYEMTGGTAGDGTGGTVLLQLLPGTANSAAMTFGNLNVHADGYGLPFPGDYSGSGNGGTGTGGSVRVDVLGGLLSAQSIMLGAVGLGGEAGESAGATAFIAADGFGGTAIFNVNGGFADITGMLALSTLGTGGFARSPSSPGNLMAAGGNGTGGTSQLMVASGTLNAGDIFIHAYGLGGNTDEVSDSDATSGGNGFGGTAAVALNAGASITATSLEILASGEGGAGGDSFGFGNAGSGGNGNGGSARFDAQDASYDLPTLSLAAQGIGGAAGSAGSGLAGAVGDGTGGTTRFSNGGTAAPTGVRRVGDLSFNVSGTGTTIFSGRMEVSNTAGSGGGLAVTGDLIATGTGPAANGAGFYFTGAGDSLSIGGAATISTGGNAEFNLDGAGSFAVTGALQLDAGQNIIVRHSNQTASPTASILADSINLASLGFIQGESGSLFSGASSMTFSSGGYIVTDRLRSGGPVLLNAANGIVSVATDLDASGMVQSTGQAINIRSLGILNVALATASAGDLSIVADNGLILGSGTASGGIALGSTSGDLAIGNLAAASIQISSFGTASFSGLSDAGIISVSSGNIVIGTNAQLGTAGNTALLTLANSRTMNPTFVGGGDSASGYSLSAAEMLRLFSDDIAISGTFGGSAEPDLVVDSFSMASRASVASGNLGANGSLSILSGGDIQIVGDVALTGLGAENQLFFTASGTTGPGAIEVDAENASIRLSDSNGGIIGRVNFEAAEVFMATADAISDVRAAQDTDAISARLALNDVVVRDSIISAGTIFANVDEGLYIQNVGASDAFADRRGFAALTDTLDISTGSAATRIIVNGQLVQTTGAMLSGLDVIPLVRINGVVGPSSGNFDQRSTVNGCLIASPVLCTVNIDELPNLPPPHDNIRDPLEVGESGTGSDLFPTMVVELKDFEPFGYPPLIDEPVTGAGNDDLWMPACEAGGERAGCTEPGQD